MMSTLFNYELPKYSDFQFMNEGHCLEEIRESISYDYDPLKSVSQKRQSLLQTKPKRLRKKSVVIDPNQLRRSDRLISKPTNSYSIEKKTRTKTTSRKQKPEDLLDNINENDCKKIASFLKANLQEYKDRLKSRLYGDKDYVDFNFFS